VLSINGAWRAGAALLFLIRELMRGLFAFLGLCAALSAAQSYAEAQYANCADFKSRLPYAEQALGVPLPSIRFEDGGTVGDYRHFVLSNLKDFEAELACRTDGGFASFEIRQEDSDDYSAQRFFNLATAALWAYTSSPPAKAKQTIRDLLIKAAADDMASRIRGDKFDNGTATLDLGNNIDLRIEGGQHLGLYLLIDAAEAGH
jgi:hypothetical protein